MIKEDAVRKAMFVFSETEKKLLNMMISTEQQGAVELLHPFYFERMMDYFNKYIPEQTSIIYPLFFTEVDNVPQLKETLTNAMKTILLNAKADGKEKIDVVYARRILRANGFNIEHVDSLLKNTSNFIWDEVIGETNKLVEDILKNLINISKITIEMPEMKEVEKELPQLSVEQRVVYLANTKSMYLFLTYMNEIVGKKEYFDYVSKNLIGKIMFDEKNRNFAEKIVLQVNSFLKNNDKSKYH